MNRILEQMKIITIDKDKFDFDALNKFYSKPQILKTKRQLCREWRYKFKTGFVLKAHVGHRSWVEVKYFLYTKPSNFISHKFIRKAVKHLIKFGEI